MGDGGATRGRTSDGHSPLQEIEALVQERAKAISLDMAEPDGARHLRALIEREVEQWSDDHKRGLRPFELPDPQALVERTFRNLAGYGPLHPLLHDDNVWEIMINAPDLVAIGDWDCDGSRTPAVLRPSSGALFLFDGWSAPGEDRVARAGPVVAASGALGFEARGCGQATVRMSDGSEQLVSTTNGGR